jgi:PKD repeat protein
MLYSINGASTQPPPPIPPSASFTASCANLTCSVNGSASTGGSGAIARYDWSFGDGASTTGVTAVRTYAVGGSYTIALKVTDSNGLTATSSKPVAVSVTNQAPVASFAVACQSLACTFTDKSTDTDGTVASWSWSFGDGGVSTVRSPSHTFAAAGPFPVQLKVTDNVGATSSVTQYVTVSVAVPTAEFTVACSGGTCQFTDASVTTSGIKQWNWSFGDGTTSTVQNPSHAYTASGTFSVRLEVTDETGEKSSTSRNVVVALPQSGIKLTANAYKSKGQHTIDLSWSGATGSSVSIYRNSAFVRNVANSGAYTDSPGGNGRGDYRYKICELSSGVCSNEVLVQIR